MTQLDDALLAAYVDGQLGEAKNKSIGLVLKNDAVSARRAEALREAHRKLELAFETLLIGEWAEIEARADERPDADYDAMRRKIMRMSRVRGAAAGLCLFALGGAAGYTLALIL